MAPGNEPVSLRKPPLPTPGPSVPSVSNATSAAPRGAQGRGRGAAPAGCAPPGPPERSAGAPKPEVDLLLGEMRLLRGLLGRVILEMKGPAPPAREAALATPRARGAERAGAPQTRAAGR